MLSDVEEDGALRVALVANAAPGRNAVGNLVAEKASFFLERQADVRVFVESTASLHPALRRLARAVDAATLEGPDWAFVRDADLVLFEYSQGFGLLDWLPALARERPHVVVEYLGVTPPAGWPGPQRESLEQGQTRRGIVWFADAVMALSDASRAELAAACGYPAEHVLVLAPPIDLDAWSPGTRQAHDVPGLLFVGRLAPNKRLALAIEALARLDPPAELWVAGDASDVYAEEARRCQGLARDLGIADRIRWLGQVEDDRLRDLYRQASLLVQPSVHEGFGLPVREAQACGLPVVAAHAAALPETVGDAGLTFTPDDVDDFVRQIRRGLDPALAGELRRRGLKRAQAASRPRWREAFAAFLEKVLETERTRASANLVLRGPQTPLAVDPQQGTVLLTVSVENRGKHPVLSHGPAAVRLAVELRDGDTGAAEFSTRSVPLPEMVLPGACTEMAIPLPVPQRAGTFDALLWPEDATGTACGIASEISLRVRASAHEPGSVAALVQAAQTSVAKALAHQKLPDDYLDVGAGLLGRLKIWIKRKLLHNFRTGYVDVLSRQQSEINRELIDAVRRLAECCRRLEESGGPQISPRMSGAMPRDETVPRRGA